MNISNFLLHPAAEKQLQQFAAKPAHAVLLSGPHGIGKTHIARKLAADILGLKNESQLENAAYFKAVVPQDGTITIEQVRDLIHFFRLKVPGKHTLGRVAVIQDADTLGLEAQNALLKQLEEPPTDSVLILTTARPGRLLPTIRSRTTLLHISAPPIQAVQAHFESAGYDTQAVRSAVLRARTDIAQSAVILNGEASNADSLQLVKKVLAGTVYDRLLLVETLAKQKEAAKVFTNDLASVAVASLEASAHKSSTVARWRQVLEAASIAQESLEQNGNAKLVLSELMLSL